MPGIDHITDAQFEVFEPTAEDILRWVETTRPVPPRADVVEHVRNLRRDGLIEPAEVEQLVNAGYPDLCAL